MQKGFIVTLPGTLMVDSDLTVKKVATIFFKNSVKRNWDSQEFKDYILKNIVQLMENADRPTLTYYKEILRFVFEKESADSLKDVLEKVPAHIQSIDAGNNYIALLILLLIQDNDILRYNKSIVQPLVESVGASLMDKLLVYLKGKNYAMARLLMKYVTRMAKQHTMPPFLNDFGAYTTLCQTSKDVLSISDKTLDVEKLKKWVLRFLHRATHKAFKKFHKDTNITDFIVQKSMVTDIYNACRNIIYQNSGDEAVHEKTVVCALEYIMLLLDEKEYFPLIIEDISFYLTSLVLKIHMFSEKAEMDFEDFPDTYLIHKYNYYSQDLKAVSGTFFTNLVKKLKKYPNYFDGIFKYLCTILTNARETPTMENARLGYGALGLVALVSHHITSMKKGEAGDFLMDYVFPLLSSEHVFLQSQTCHTLQFFEGNVVRNEAIFSVLERVHKFTSSPCDVLRVDAAHAVRFFFSSDMVQPAFVPLIPEIIQALIDLNNRYHIESLSDVLEEIINSYPDEVAQFAPKLTEALTVLVAQHLTNYNDDKLMLVAGYLRTIGGMISTISRPELLREMFRCSFDLLMFIFKEKKSDFYQESIDMMVNYVYNLKSVDEPMWFVFKMILSIDSELTNNVDEITNLVDNFISFGKEKILHEEYFSLVTGFIEKMCMGDQDDFFEDDHNCGCRIMESLLLNNGQLLTSKLDAFVGYAIYNKSFFENGSSAWVYSLNVVMHCFVVNPPVVIQALHAKGFSKEFFDKLYDNLSMFGRVHDKKSVLLFMGVLCGQPAMELNYRRLAKVLVSMLKTLPEAINKRNDAKHSEEKSEESIASEDEDTFSDYNDDMLDEDIYFETILDTFDPFPYMIKVLGEAPSNSVGERLVGALSESQKETIQKILSVEQPKQT